ncbi:MAG: SPOR domain-containing protein [Bacteroidales bacterium]|nr:SPOR domain-containing protein [Bacteroidales bacterium]
MIKKILILFTIATMAWLPSTAQNYIFRGGNVEQSSAARQTEQTESVQQASSQAAAASTDGKLTIKASKGINSAMQSYIEKNSERKMSGYRVRIFFDNKRTARTLSQEVADGFQELYPAIGVYREYENPYFKVTVGNFRTKNDALLFLKEIVGIYPSSFIVHENIEYPLFLNVKGED